MVELTAVETVLMSYEDTQESLFSLRVSRRVQFGSFSLSPVIAAVGIEWLESLSCGHQPSLPAPEHHLEIIT